MAISTVLQAEASLVAEAAAMGAGVPALLVGVGGACRLTATV